MAQARHAEATGSTSYGTGYTIGAAILVAVLVIDFVWVISTALSVH